MSLLRDHIPGRLIAWFGGVEWQARSPDLSPLAFFRLIHLKEIVYRDSPEALP